MTGDHAQLTLPGSGPAAGTIEHAFGAADNGADTAGGG